MIANRKASLPLAIMPDSLSVELGVPLGVMWFVYALTWRDDQAKMILVHVQPDSDRAASDSLHVAIVDEVDVPRLIPRGVQFVPLWSRKRFAEFAALALQTLKPLAREGNRPWPS